MNISESMLSSNDISAMLVMAAATSIVSVSYLRVSLVLVAVNQTSAVTSGSASAGTVAVNQTCAGVSTLTRTLEDWFVDNTIFQPVGTFLFSISSVKTSVASPMFSICTGNWHVVPGAHLGVGSGRITSGNLSGNILIVDSKPSSTSE